MKNFRSLLTLASILFLVSCSSSPYSPQPNRKSASELNSTATKRARIIAMTDFHGSIEPIVTKNTTGAEVELGGAALFSAYAQILRKDAGQTPTFLFDGGDLFQGSYLSNSVEGKPVIRFFNSIGVDAVAIGNHDFDYGPVGPDPAPKKRGQDRRGALLQRMKEAKFPFLAANIRFKKGGTPPWANASALIEKSGVKVGVIGIASINTPNTTLSANVDDIDFVAPAPEVIAQSKALKSKGADFVVLIAHSGGGCKDNSPDKIRDLSSCVGGELPDILKAIPAGTIDLAIGGHTHFGIFKIDANGVGMLQAYSGAKNIAWADLSNDPASRVSMGGLVQTCGKMVQGTTSLTCDPSVVKATGGVPVQAQFLGQPIVRDEKIQKQIAPDIARVKKVMETPIGVEALTDVNKDYYPENALGNMLADFMREKYPEADLVMLNNGGLRTNLPKGPLNFGHVFNICPFDNTLAWIEMDGATLRKMIELGISKSDGGMSWSGLTFEADNCKVTSIKTETKAFEENQKYKILTSDFIAQGGAGMKKLQLKPEQIKTLPDGLRDSILESIKNTKKQIRAEDFFSPTNKRQLIKTECPAPVAADASAHHD